jgi:hypothetical protein
MCAVFKTHHSISKPSQTIAAISSNGCCEHVWAGFARAEILGWWIDRKGGRLLDVPATEFAERSDATGKLVWESIPSGLVIRGLLDNEGRKSFIRIVTRESTPAELERFQHPRMPLLEKPLFPDVEIPAGRVSAMDLFPGF